MCMTSIRNFMNATWTTDTCQVIHKLMVCTRSIPLQDIYRETLPSSSLQQQKLRVCEVCAAYLSLYDNDRRWIHKSLTGLLCTLKVLEELKTYFKVFWVLNKVNVVLESSWNLSFSVLIFSLLSQLVKSLEKWADLSLSRFIFFKLFQSFVLKIINELLVNTCHQNL